MRVVSREILNPELIEKVINSIEGFIDQMQKDVGAEYPLVSIEIELETRKIYVTWRDYSDEEARVRHLIERYMELKQKLADPLKQPTLFSEIIKIAEEFKRLTGLSIEEVVG